MAIRDNYDVVIAGGGPAGLAAAATAAIGDACVLLLERSRQIGYPVKTSGGSFVDDLTSLGIPSHLFHPIQRIRLRTQRAEALFSYKKPTFCVVDTKLLLEHLARDAVSQGAQVLCGARVVSATREGTLQRVDYIRSDGTPSSVAAQVLIDATGAGAVVSRATGLGEGFKRLGIGTEFEIIAPRADQHEATLWYGSSVAPSGYGWIFPLGKSRVRVGVGAIIPDRQVDTRKYAWDLLRRYVRENLGASSWSILEVHAGVVPAEGMNEVFVKRGVVAVGDSAGQASCLTGEGIRYAIEAGQRAGKASARFSQTGLQADLLGYQADWLRDHGGMYRRAYKLNRRLVELTDSEWDKSIELSTHLTPEEFAELLHGDFKTTALSVLRTPIRASRLAKQARRLLDGQDTGKAT